jgi:hypothetical protein
VALNTLIRAVRREFVTVVGAQHAELAAVLYLRNGLHTLNGIRSISLVAKDHNPHIAIEVIDEQHEVASSSRCSQCYRATKVLAHELKPLLGSEARLLGKGEPTLLRQHIDVIELLHMVKAQHAS